MTLRLDRFQTHGMPGVTTETKNPKAKLGIFRHLAVQKLVDFQGEPKPRQEAAAVSEVGEYESTRKTIRRVEAHLLPLLPDVGLTLGHLRSAKGWDPKPRDAFEEVKQIRTKPTTCGHGNGATFRVDFKGNPPSRKAATRKQPTSSTDVVHQRSSTRSTDQNFAQKSQSEAWLKQKTIQSEKSR